MSHLYPLDTLSIAKDLINAGFTQSQAEAQARIFRDYLELTPQEREKELEAKQLATKGDLQKAEIHLIYWIIGNFIALAAMILFK